jgi:hypothetical protein
MADTIEMRLRTEPEFIQFKPDQTVEGILVAMKKMQVTEEGTGRVSNTVKFVVQDGDRVYAFLGTYQLCEKLRPADIGHAVRIRYMGENTSVGRNGKQMREFEVFVSVAKVEDVFITDNDIPF